MHFLAPEDYLDPISLNFVFEPPLTINCQMIEIVDDSVNEPLESFTFVIDPVQSDIAVGAIFLSSATVTIVDDDDDVGPEQRELL